MGLELGGWYTVRVSDSVHLSSQCMIALNCVLKKENVCTTHMYFCVLADHNDNVHMLESLCMLCL